MYTPKNFQNTNAGEITEFIRKNGFGILVSSNENKILASHIPLHLSVDAMKLTGHISKGNPQWKSFSNHDVLAIFNGPHAYISSSWYNHENVPTWNYIAAHVYGKTKIIEGDALVESLKNLVDNYEKGSDKPVTIESISPDYLKKNIAGIVGFEITINKIEATYKLSQNRDDESYHNIVYELEKRGDENASQVAALMKNNRCPIH
jgi:transcriptional regulator